MAGHKRKQIIEKTNIIPEKWNFQVRMESMNRSGKRISHLMRGFYFAQNEKAIDGKGGENEKGRKKTGF